MSAYSQAQNSKLMSRPKVTIIIPTLNGEEYIDKCLESVFDQSFQDFKVIIFDNNSKDKTIDIAQQYPVKIIEKEENLGWAKANNICVQQTDTKYAFLLNMDTILDKNCLRELYEFAESKNGIGCISPRIVEYDNFLNDNIEDGYPLTFDIDNGLIKAYDLDKDSMEVGFVPGTALFANLSNLNGSLRFREDFFMYHEDVEFSLRILSETDFKLYFLNTAIVAHDSKQSFSRTSTCRLAIRNLFTCLKTHQSNKSFLKNCGTYAKNLFDMYIQFYHRYFPLTYPVFATFYFLKSILYTGNSLSSNLQRLQRINKKMSSHDKKFEFIF